MTVPRTEATGAAACDRQGVLAEAQSAHARGEGGRAGRGRLLPEMPLVSACTRPAAVGGTVHENTSTSGLRQYKRVLEYLSR